MPKLFDMMPPEVQKRMLNPPPGDATEIYDVIGNIETDRITPPIDNLHMGPFIMDASGIRLFNNGIPTIYLDNDGDAFFGANLDDPAFTSLIIFSNDQPYNNEDFEEGDVLVGDNSSSRANMFWDRSTGKLQFRGGTTMAAEIDTDGSLLAGGGNVKLDASGITISGTDELMRFANINGDVATLFIDASENLQLRLDGAGDFTFSDADIILDQDSPTDAVVAFHESGTPKAQVWWDVSGNDLVLQNLETGTTAIVLDVADTGGEWNLLNATGPTIEYAFRQSGETVLNEQGRDVNHRFEGANNTSLLNLDAGTDTVQMGAFGAANGGELTIAAGVITVTHSHHTVDTQNDDATDNLDTINGGGFAGQLLFFRAANAARTVVAKDGTGNLLLAGDFSMDTNQDMLLLYWTGANWIELSRSNNA